MTAKTKTQQYRLMTKEGGRQLLLIDGISYATIAKIGAIGEADEPETRARGEFIRRACNRHEPNIRTMKEAIAELRKPEGDIPSVISWLETAINQAR